MDRSDDALRVFRMLLKHDYDGFTKSMTSSAVHVDELVRFAHKHRLGAFTYQRLEPLAGSEGLSRGSLLKARASALIEQQRSRDLAVLLPELAELCTRHQVPVLFMKGPLFAQRFYGGIEGRGFADIDILLQNPEDLDRIELLLKARGFRPTYKIFMNRAISRYFSHHFGYQRGKLSLEVHWALQRHFTFAFDYERVWSTSCQVAFGGRTYEATSPEYELVLQIVGVLTDLQVGKLLLRSFVDIYHVMSQLRDGLCWDEFLENRARERILRPSVFILSLTLDLLDCHEEFRPLSELLRPAKDELPPLDEAYSAVFHSEKRDVHQKILAFRLYEAPLLASFVWWLVSLPFRTAVYAAEQRL